MSTASVARRRAVRDIGGSVLLILIALLLLPLTEDFGRTGKVFPRVLLWTLIALNASQIAVAAVRLRRADTRERAAEGAGGPRVGWVDVRDPGTIPGRVGPFSRKAYGGLFIAGSIVYVLLIPHLGYLLATFLLLLTGLRIAFERWWTSAVLAAIVAGSMFLILTRLLSASVPRGIFG